MKEEMRRMEEGTGQREVKGSAGGRRGRWLRHLQPKGDGKRGRCVGEGGRGPGGRVPPQGVREGAVTQGREPRQAEED